MNVVGEEVEGVALLQLEASVVPVAGQNAVLDGPPSKRKAHVWTAVVDGVDLALVMEERDWSAVTAHDCSTLVFEVRQRCDLHVLGVFDCHS